MLQSRLLRPACALALFSLIGGCSAPALRPPAPPTPPPPAPLATRVREGKLRPRSWPTQVDFRRLAWVGHKPQLVAEWHAVLALSTVYPATGFVSATTGELTPLFSATPATPPDTHNLRMQALPSPDGRLLAYLAHADRPAGVELHLRSLADGKDTVISSDLKSALGGSLVWTWDGTGLIYQGGRRAPGIWLVKLDDRKPVRLSTLDLFGFVLSPSGRSLAGGYLRLGAAVEPVRHGLRVIDVFARRDAVHLSDCWSPSWRGEELWYVTRQPPNRSGDRREESLGQAIAYRANSGAGPPVTVAHAPEGKGIIAAEMAPDGSGLCVTLMDIKAPLDRDTRSLWLLNADGREWYRLSDRVAAVAWSPDNRLAWATPAAFVDGRGAGLYVLETDR